MSTVGRDIKAPNALPPPNSDFYQLAETLPAEELATLRQVRSFMESKVAPIINSLEILLKVRVRILAALYQLRKTQLPR